MSAQFDEHVKKHHAFRAVFDPIIEALERQDARAAWLAANPPPPRKQPIAKDELFILTAGDYSDFRVEDLFEALTDFDLAEVYRDIRRGHIAAEIVKRELAKPVPHQEINTYDLG